MGWSGYREMKCRVSSGLNCAKSVLQQHSWCNILTILKLIQTNNHKWKCVPDSKYVTSPWSPCGEADSDKWPASLDSRKWSWSGNHHSMYGKEDTSKALCWENFSVPWGILSQEQPKHQVNIENVKTLFVNYVFRNPIGIESDSLWTSEFSIGSFNLRSGYQQRQNNDSILEFEFASIFCFIISTLLVFILSLSLALVVLKCYDYFKARNSQVFWQNMDDTSCSYYF